MSRRSNALTATLEVLGRIDRVEAACYTPEEERMIRQRLRDLGCL